MSQVTVVGLSRKMVREFTIAAVQISDMTLRLEQLLALLDEERIKRSKAASKANATRARLGANGENAEG